MKRQAYSLPWLIVALVMLIGGTTGTTWAAPAAPGGPNDITGHWASVDCEARPAGGGQITYIKRDFRNNADGTWSGTFPLYADAHCTQPTLTFAAQGRYTLGSGSATVAGATEVYFTFDKILITPHAQGNVDYLNSAGGGRCGANPWQAGVTQDVSAGCAALGVDLTTCGGEYDLVKVMGNDLYYGARPDDGGFLCTLARRPTALQVPVVRVTEPGMPTTGDGAVLRLLGWGLTGLALAAAGLLFRRRALAR